MEMSNHLIECFYSPHNLKIPNNLKKKKVVLQKSYNTDAVSLE